MSISNQFDTRTDTQPQDGTVGKAMTILDIVATASKPMRFNEIATASPFPKATTYRFVQTMTNQGMLNYDDDNQRYGLGVRLLRLAHNAWQQASLAPVAASVLDQLCDHVQETVHLAQIEDGHVLFIDKRRTSERFETLAQAGRIAPAHCTGVGKAMLAFLPSEKQAKALQQQTFAQFTPNTITKLDAFKIELDAIRAHGVAFDREEHELGVISIAAPITSSRNQVIGALSIASSTTKHSLDDLVQFQPALLDAAKTIGIDAETWHCPALY